MVGFLFFLVGLLKWVLFHLTIYVMGFHEVDFHTVGRITGASILGFYVVDFMK